MRVLAALAVVLAHFTESYSTGWPDFAESARSAVAVFFVLSGFVISYVVEKRESDPREYAIARIARLYSVMVPSVILSGVVLLVGCWLSPGMVHAVASERNLLPLHNWPISRFFVQSALTLTFLNSLHGHGIWPAMNMPAWSLGFEGPYYAMFGIAIFGRGAWRVGLLIGCALLFGGDILRLFPVWLAGVALHRALRTMPERHARLKGLLCVAALIAGMAEFNAFSRWALQSHGPVADTLLHGIFRANRAPQFYYWGVLTVLAIYAVAALEPWLRGIILPFSKPIRWSAGHTFSLYLYHMPLMVLVYWIVPYKRDNSLQKSLVLFAIVVVCVLLSEITERQKHRWKAAVTRAFDWLHIGTAKTDS